MRIQAGTKSPRVVRYTNKLESPLNGGIIEW
jgi:hypothetical protein